MKTKYVFCLLLTFILVSQVNAGQLLWTIPTGDRLEIVKTAAIKYYLNSKVKKIYFERNIVDLTCSQNINNASRVQGIFSLFHKELEQKVFNLREQYNTDFTIDQTGKYIVSDRDFMPNLRHIPTFPVTDLKPGQSWSANAELVINSFSRPFKLTFPVEYTLKKITQKEKDVIARLEYRYTINYTMPGKGVPKDFPAKIYGKNLGFLDWNITRQKPETGTDNYKIIFIMPPNEAGVKSLGFEMKILSHYRLYAKISEQQKEQAKEELKKELPQDRGIAVDTDKRGLVIRMGEILFDFDSSRLRNETPAKLGAIITVLKKKYKDREIIVEGHTDSTGKKEYNEKLSLNRARRVAEYLRSRIDHDKLSFRGFGSDKPIADNVTKQGRQKNRRVDIIIKLN